MHSPKSIFVAIAALVFVGQVPAQPAAGNDGAREINLISSKKSVYEQVDFVREYALLFRWDGSPDDMLALTAEKDKVEFRYTAGAREPNVAYVRLFAIPNKMEWRSSNDFLNKLKAATKITTAAELDTALEQRTPSVPAPAIMLAGYPAEAIPDIAVPFGYRLIVERNRPVTPDVFKRLAACKNLTFLVVEGSIDSELPDAGLKHLASAPRLNHLCLAFTKVSNAGLKELARSKSLTALELTYVSGNEDGLKELAQLKRLDTLLIEPAGEINDKTLHTLRAIGLLHALPGAKAKGNARPRSAEEVVELKLFDTKITDAGLKDLTIFKNLTSLDVGTMMRFFDNAGDYNRSLFKDYGGGLTDAGMKELVHFKRLNTLAMRGTAITGEGFKHLATLEELAVLDLGDVKNLTEAGLKNLKAHKNLTRLSLDGSPLSDAGVKELLGLKKLTMLDLRETGVTQVGVAELSKSLPNLKQLLTGSRMKERRNNGDKSASSPSLR